MRARLAVLVALVSAVVGGIVWMANKMFTIRSGSGTSIGLSVRTDTHIATWIQTLEPYVPSLHRDAGKDRYSLAIFLVPLDGTEPHLVPVHRGLTPNQFALARILGSDGRSLWVDASGLSTIDQKTLTVQAVAGPAPKNLKGEPPSRFAPNPQDLLAAGFLTGANTWLGLHSEAELARDYRSGKYVRRVVAAENRREDRRFQRGTLEPDSSGKYHRIESMVAIRDESFSNAGFLRLASDTEPLRLHDPDGALMVYTRGLGQFGTLTMARVDEDGHVLWQTDTGIDRFTVQQILPGAQSTAFVGTRPREPDRVPEPLLVIVDHATGHKVTHTLWR
jgi:hypothetical protein